MLCCLRCLNPRHKRISDFNPSGSKMLTILFFKGKKKNNRFYLNALIVSEFIKIGSRCNHLLSEAWKKENLQYSV